MNDVRRWIYTPRRHVSCGAGMTLLEIMLALTLMSILLASISMAIDLHLRMLDSRRGDVERVQVARAILQLIANDLRSAVQPCTTDFSSLASMATEALAGGSLPDDLGGLVGDAGGGAGGSGGSGDMGMGDYARDTGDGLTLSSSSIASTETSPPVPGLYGNQYELQVDVSRIPRIDEMQRMLANSGLGVLEDIPSDVKTVAYYLHDPNSSMSTGDFRDAAGNPQAGLVRRVLDRAVTLYATNTASSVSLANAGEIIAPEIGAIQFEYYDGLEWVYEWDSEQLGGLPMAVRITIFMLPEESLQQPDSRHPANRTQRELEASPDAYSLTVRLPTALPSESTADQSGMEAVGL